MLLGLIRFFRGYVRFKVIGKFPERFINLAMKNGIGVFDARSSSEELYASVVVSDYRYIRPVARRAGVKLRITKRYGLPFFTYKFRYRWGIAAGVLFFAIFSLIMQNFVWTVELNGVDSISTSQLMTALANNGFAVGKFKGTLDLHSIERQIQLQFDEIGWMSINLIGTHAQIEIKEKALVPNAEISDTPSNIKAKCDGVIVSTNIRRGTAEIAPGSAVSKGQLVVSGFYENALGELHFVDADAEIIANTSHSFSAACGETAVLLVPDTITNRSRLQIYWVDFPVTFSSESFPYSVYTQSHQLYLDGKPVPLTVSTQYVVNYKEVSIGLDKSAAEKQLNARCTLYKLFVLNSAIDITENVKIEQNGGVYKVKADYSCIEDIALKENFVVNSE